MPDELAVKSVKQWDDVLMQGDGTVKEITRVRFFVGNHGPFERVFDRNPDANTVANAIRDQKAALQQLEAL